MDFTQFCLKTEEWNWSEKVTFVLEYLILQNALFLMGELTVVLIFKKGLRSDHANHRSVSLIPVAYKVLTSVILRSLYSTREGETREEQPWFGAGRGCFEQTFIFRRVLQHRFTFQRPTVIVFLDICATLDC